MQESYLMKVNIHHDQNKASLLEQLEIEFPQTDKGQL